jgi:hypothetical protein
MGVIIIKTHDHLSFYKYCTADTLKKILASKRFRWNAPVNFNDPFDHLTQISLTDNPLELKEYYLEECKKFIFDKEEPNILYPNEYSNALSLLRANANNLSQDEILKELAEGFDEGLENVKNDLAKVNAEWEKAIRTARIFCVSEAPQNFLMWAHYADSHSGAMLELKCIEELDTPLCAASKVEYKKQMPKLGSYKEILRSSLGLIPQPTNKQLYHDLAYVKSDVWSYEKEWRCITYREKEGLYSDFNFFPEEIASIYLGCRMKEKDKEEILQLIHSGFSHSEVFEMMVDTSEYKINPKKTEEKH